MTARGMVGVTAALLTLAAAGPVVDWVQTHPVILAAVVIAAVVIAVAALPRALEIDA